MKNKLKKTLKCLIYLIIFLLIIILASYYYLLKTNSGLNSAVKYINKFTNITITADEIKGNLLDVTTIKNLSISSDKINFHSENISLALSSTSIFRRKLVIDKLKIDNSKLEIIKKSTKTESKLFAFADIKLPLQINLKDMSVTNFEMTNKLNKTSFLIDDFKLQGTYEDGIAKVTNLILNTKAVNLNTAGKLKTTENYPLDFKTTLYIKNTDWKQRLDIDIKGNIQQGIKIIAKGSGLADFTLKSTVEDAFNNPELELLAHLVIQKINLSKLGIADSDISANLDLSLKKLYLIKLTGKVTTRQKTIKESFDLDLSGDIEKNIKLILNGKGFADFSTVSDISSVLLKPKFTSKVNIKQVDFTKINLEKALLSTDLNINGEINIKKKNTPLNIISKGIINYNSTKTGELKLDLNSVLEGSLQKYKAKISTLLNSVNYPKAEVVIELEGEGKKLKDYNLLVKTLGGEIKTTGSLQLKPNLNIKALLVAKNLQPQKFYPQVKANINTKIILDLEQIKDSKGKNKLIAKVNLKELTGKLDGKIISGKGDLLLDGKNLKLDKLDINLADNRIFADGLVNAKQINIKYNLDAKKLSAILPNLSGLIVANGEITGSPQKPNVKVVAKINNFKFKDIKINNLTLNGSISQKDDKILLKAKALNLLLAKQNIDSANIDIDGKISNHKLSLSLISKQQSLKLTSTGNLNLKAKSYKTKLKQLDLFQEKAGLWKLKGGADIFVSTKKITVSNMCLAQNKIGLCIKGGSKINSGKLNGEFDILVKDFNTQNFKELMPKALQIQTIIAGKTKLKIVNNQLSFKGNLKNKAGQVIIKSVSGIVKSKIKKLNLDFELKNNKLISKLNLSLNKLLNLEAKLALPNVKKPNINANIKLNSPDLRFVQRLVPQITDVKGSMKGSFVIAGNISKNLNITGGINLNKARFNIPKYGTQIRKLELKVFAKNKNEIGFAGTMFAEKGKLTIKGGLNPKTRKGKINIKGKKLLIANSRKISLEISPDINITLEDVIKIRGKIFIPKALIVPESNAKKIVTSGDVIIRSKHKKKKTKAVKNNLIDAEILIKLGKNVKVASADIETRLFGGIKINVKPNKAIQATGAIEVEKGELRVYGQLLNIKRGRVIFGKGPIDNPALDIKTIREVDDVVVGVNVLGFAKSPEVSLFSTPAMADSSILSYLIFGKPPNSDSFGAGALLQMGGVVGANTIARDLKKSIGLDVLDFSLTGMEAGKNVSKKLYLGMRSNFFNSINEFLLKYKLTSKLKLEGATGGKSAYADLTYTFETD